MIEPTITIRHAVMRDAGRITESNILMARETEARDLDPRLALQGVKAVLKDRHKGFYLLAETRASAPELAGQLLVTPEWSDWRDAWFWWIQSVYVPPVFRGQKIFSRLYRHLEETARMRKDVTGLRLYVEKHNLHAREVYEALGMTRTIYEMYEIEF